jgi:hypothetical protein
VQDGGLLAVKELAAWRPRDTFVPTGGRGAVHTTTRRPSRQAALTRLRRATVAHRVYPIRSTGVVRRDAIRQRARGVLVRDEEPYLG